jgi:hypothetical protein
MVGFPSWLGRTEAGRRGNRSCDAKALRKGDTFQKVLATNVLMKKALAIVKVRQNLA